jgi:hypothetical protein
MGPTPGRRFKFRKRLAPHTTEFTRPAVSKPRKTWRSEGVESLREITSLRNRGLSHSYEDIPGRVPDCAELSSGPHSRDPLASFGLRLLGLRE